MATEGDSKRRFHLDMYKTSPGACVPLPHPFTCVSAKVLFSVARAVFGDAMVRPHGGSVVDVVATAKRDLKASDPLDGCGQFMTGGQCGNADVTAAQRLLPITHTRAFLSHRQRVVAIRTGRLFMRDHTPRVRVGQPRSRHHVIGLVDDLSDDLHRQDPKLGPPVSLGEITDAGPGSAGAACDLSRTVSR